MIFCDCTSTLYSLLIATARKYIFEHHESLPLQLQSGNTKSFIVTLQNILSSGTPSRENRYPSKHDPKCENEDKSSSVWMPVSKEKHDLSPSLNTFTKKKKNFNKKKMNNNPKPI